MTVVTALRDKLSDVVVGITAINHPMNNTNSKLSLDFM